MCITTVGFAADIYGADLQEDLSQDQRIEQATMYRSNPELFVQRMQKALEEVKKFEDVDSENIAVIGYCFGGKIAASVQSRDKYRISFFVSDTSILI